MPIVVQLLALLTAQNPFTLSPQWLRHYQRPTASKPYGYVDGHYTRDSSDYRCGC